MPEGECEYYHVASDNSFEEKYIFKVGDTRLAEMVFSKKTQNDRYGIKSYSVKSLEIKSLTSYKITFNSTFNVFINGEVIDPRYLFSKTEIASPVKDFSQKEITKDLYFIEELYYIADIKAYDFDGTSCDINYNSLSQEYEIKRNDKEIKEKITEFTNGFLAEYFNYTLIDDSKSKKLLKYIHSDSYLYKELKNYSIEDNVNYKKGNIEKTTLQNTECYGNNYYSTEISADFIALDKEDTQIKISFNKTLYFVLDNEKLYVIDIV